MSETTNTPSRKVRERAVRMLLDPHQNIVAVACRSTHLGQDGLITNHAAWMGEEDRARQE